jgi:hypothetical protein
LRPVSTDVVAAKALFFQQLNIRQATFLSTNHGAVRTWLKDRPTIFFCRCLPVKWRNTVGTN